MTDNTEYYLCNGGKYLNTMFKLMYPGDNFIVDYFKYCVDSDQPYLMSMTRKSKYQMPTIKLHDIRDVRDFEKIIN